jgi:V8-like Glu-specific endopeptidase
MQTQNAQSVFIKTAEDLLLDGEIERTIDVLLNFDDQADIGIRQDIIQQSGNFKRNKKMFDEGRLRVDDFDLVSARTSHSLLEIIKEIPKRIDLNARINSLGTYSFTVPDNDHLEKIIGGKSSILRINWLEKALKASKAVCRVVCADGSLGTGFLTKEGYVFTNNHVISSKEAAATAKLEFNYELDASGNAKNRIIYDLDPSDFATSDKGMFDFAKVKVVDRKDNPLSNWGYVEFELEAIPAVGEAVTIIQHPKGEDKQIALNANEVLGQLNQHLYYTTDTEPGSSGSPVFNKDWKVVAIHHAGKTLAEGGFKVNARGDIREANRGILFRDIFNFLKTGATVSPNADGGKLEHFTPATPDPTPVADTKPTQPEPVIPKEKPVVVEPTPVKPTPPPVSQVPKFVVVYDIADATQSQMLNRHLNVLKITKKIKVYNVQEVPVGLDPIQAATQELTDADYMVALITVNLLNSPDWFSMVYEALESGRRIIPLRMGNVDLEGTGLEKLRTLPTGNRAVTDFPNQDAAFTDIVGELKKLLPR